MSKKQKMNVKTKKLPDGKQVNQYFDASVLVKEVVKNRGGSTIMEMFFNNNEIIKIIDYKNNKISKIITFDENLLISSHKIFINGSFFSGQYKHGELIKIDGSNSIISFFHNFLRRKNLFTTQTLKLKNSEGMNSKG